MSRTAFAPVLVAALMGSGITAGALLGAGAVQVAHGDQLGLGRGLPGGDVARRNMAAADQGGAERGWRGDGGLQ